MVHVWDHFDYTNNVTWWKAQGWPLVKVGNFIIAHIFPARLTSHIQQGVASFHLDKLILDLHFNDSTLVTNPCNSPEQVPITFGNLTSIILYELVQILDYQVALMPSS